MPDYLRIRRDGNFGGVVEVGHAWDARVLSNLPVGSVESRAAARALIGKGEERESTAVLNEDGDLMVSLGWLRGLTVDRAQEVLAGLEGATKAES